jgi:nondiscriminating aspartyl-tRNA synthetase
MESFSIINDTNIKKPINIDDLLEKENWEFVDIEGCVNNIRRMGTFSFVIIRTNNDIIQCLTQWEKNGLINQIQEWDFIKISGNIIKNKEAYKGLEINLDNIEKLSWPIEKLSVNIWKTLKANLDFILDNRIVTLRNLHLKSIFKIQEWIWKAFREYFSQNWFTEIHSPKIVKAWAEGWTNIFELKYFNEKAFLTQSPQFYKQFLVPVYWRVFEIWPVFRAEKHKTSRHVNEYTSLDIEMWFIDSFKDIMNMEVWFLKYLFDLLKKEYNNDLDRLKITLPEIGDGIPEVKFSEIKDIIAKEYNRPFRDKFDLEPEEEVLISKYIKEKTGNDFVFITNYPEAKRPFYTMISKEDNSYTDSFDLLFKWLEITSGWQRIHDYNTQVQRFTDKWLDPKDFKEYLELHKNGAPPHGGFGLGLERLTQKLIGLENIRQAILFPRDIKRLIP